MAHTSLYRRFRPDTFDKMLGQEHIIRTLSNTVTTGNVSHAYLFTGTRGTGKTSTAKIFARAINCIAPLKDGSPCGKCEVCVQLNQLNNMDIMEIDAASNNGVDEIRELRERIKYVPSIGKFKVYIIDEAHMLTTSAFNALLKTLEEPPAHAVFILATTEAYKIPQTILSRCMRFDFRLLSSQELASHLEKIFNEIKKPFQKEALALIAEAGDGSVRDSLSLADMCITYCPEVVGYDDVLNVLGACSPQLLTDLVEQIALGDINKALLMCDKITRLGKSVELVAKDVAKAFRNILYCKNVANANNILNLPQEIFKRYLYLSNICTNDSLLRSIDIFLKVDGQMRHCSSPKIYLDMSIAKACEGSISIDTDGILQRLKEIESKIRQGALGSNIQPLSPQIVWAWTLNELQNMPNFKSGYSYASKIDEKKLYIKDCTLYICVDNEGEVSGLSHFIKEIENIICRRYFEITKVIIELDKKKDQIAQAVEQVSELFSKNVTVIK